METGVYFFLKDELFYRQQLFNCINNAYVYKGTSKKIVTLMKQCLPEDADLNAVHTFVLRENGFPEYLLLSNGFEKLPGSVERIPGKRFMGGWIILCTSVQNNYSFVHK